MKKIGIIVFIIAILVGVVFANLFSFGKASGKLINFSFGSSIKGSGVPASESRNVDGFKGVDVGGIFHVEIAAGKEFEVGIDADDNLLQFIKTEVKGDVLRISATERLKSSNPIRVRISAPDIESVEASGASKVSLTGVNNTALSIDTSGASKIDLSGETRALTIDVSGASGIDAASLKAENANVDASGASHVSLFVSHRLVSEASGASKISYLGNPVTVEKNSSGAAKIYSK
jgi:hypothetical protein